MWNSKRVGYIWGGGGWRYWSFLSLWTALPRHWGGFVVDEQVMEVVTYASVGMGAV